MKVYYTAIDLPTGPAYAAATDAGLVRLSLKVDYVQDFIEELRSEFGTEPLESERPFKSLRAELKKYFAGKPVTFTSRLDMRGTPFQIRVWSELIKVGYGSVRSYAWLAAKTGSPNAARAVGGAMHANRIAVVVPCHRIVASTGGLGGYGYGLDIKRRLLEIEGAL